MVGQPGHHVIGEPLFLIGTPHQIRDALNAVDLSVGLILDLLFGGAHYTTGALRIWVPLLRGPQWKQ